MSYKNYRSLFHQVGNVPHLFQPLVLKKFIKTGLFHIHRGIKPVSKKIVFLLQVDNKALIPNKHVSDFYGLTKYIVKEFSDWNVVMRLHPNMRKSNLTLNVKEFNNVEIHNAKDKTLSESLDGASIAVSIMSSSIMEAIAIGVIPFVFNPLYKEFNYQPDIDKLGLGIESKEIDSAKVSLSYLMKSEDTQNRYFRNIDKMHPVFFSKIGSKSLRETVKIIDNFAKN